MTSPLQLSRRCGRARRQSQALQQLARWMARLLSCTQPLPHGPQARGELARHQWCSLLPQARHHLASCPPADPTPAAAVAAAGEAAQPSSSTLGSSSGRPAPWRLGRKRAPAVAAGRCRAAWLARCSRELHLLALLLLQACTAAALAWSLTGAAAASSCLRQCSWASTVPAVQWLHRRRWECVSGRSSGCRSCSGPPRRGAPAPRAASAGRRGTE